MKAQLTADIIIVGAGVAGCATAIAIKNISPGLRITLLDRSFAGNVAAAENVYGALIKPKIGETLPSQVMIPMQRLGIWERFRVEEFSQSGGTRAIWGDAKAYANESIFSPYGSGWHLDRGRFDAMMLAIARSMDIDFQSNTRLDKLERIDGGWQLKVRRVLGQAHKNKALVSEPQNTELTASFVIDASGRSAALAKRIGANLEVYDQLVGIYRFYELSQSADATAMKGDSSTLLESMDQGWWYSAGLDRNQQVAAFMTDADFARAGKLGKRDHFERALRRTELIQPGLVELVPVTDPIVAAAHTQCLDQLAGEGWLAVGDASFTFDPLSSLGIFKALRMALVASYATKDYFDGKDRGLHKYQFLATQEFNQYLSKRREHYREETRFFDKQFWQRRGAA